MIKGHAPLGFDFRKWFAGKREELLKTSGKIIFSGEQHVPILMNFSYNGDCMPIVMAGAFGDGASKDMAASMQKMFASKVDMVAASIFLSEIWTLKSPIEAKDMPDSLSDHPDRVEAFMMNAMHGNEQVMAIWLIDRKNKKFGEVQLMDNMAKGARMEGRMTVDPPTKQ